MNRIYGIACVWFMMLGLSGCASTEDVTKNPSYPTDYMQGKVYKLKQPVFVVWYSPAYCLMAPGRFHDVPSTIREYEKGGKREWPAVRSWLPAGTRIEFRKLVLERDYTMGLTFSVLGEVLDAPEKGLKVELLFISQRNDNKPATTAPTMDPNILEITDSN